MASRNTTKTGILALLAIGVALPGLASDPARTQETTQAPASESDLLEDLSSDPVLYTSEGKDFQITFPGGCGKIVTRANEPDLWGGEKWSDIIQVSYVYCDRYQVEGEGCSVSATFNLRGEDGSMAGPAQVISRVEEVLKEFGANVVSQKAVQKDFQNGFVVEGVEVQAKAEKGLGEIWIRGLLSDGDIYVLVAWNKKGGVWGNPDYIMFFNSFQPWVE
jgi:hypothetical protein